VTGERNDTVKNEKCISVGDGAMAKVKIDKNLCTGCALCTTICGEVFELGADGKASITERYRSDDESTGEVPDDIECVDSAAESCPMGAISKE